MYQLSADVTCFASRDFQSGIDAADALRINNLELADFGGRTLERCSGDEVEDIRSALIDSNKTIVLLSTSMAVEDAGGYNDLFRRAHLLNVKNVLIRTDGRAQPPDAAATSEILRMADAWGIGVVFENRRGSFFEDDAGMTAFLNSLSGSAAVAFNPAEFVALSRHPFFHVFYTSRLKNSIRFLRLNDSLYSTGEPTRLAGGNGEIKELISILLARGFSGYFSVTPYRGGSVEAMAETLGEYRALLKAL